MFRFIMGAIVGFGVGLSLSLIPDKEKPQKKPEPRFEKLFHINCTKCGAHARLSQRDIDAWWPVCTRADGSIARWCPKCYSKKGQ